MSLTPKNWDSFQHYKDRAPAWIKLHRGLLDDFAFSRLPVASRALAPLLWLLASEYEGGSIPCTTEEIAFRFRMTEKELIAALNPLIEGGFFVSDSALLAECKQVASLEKEREEEKRRVDTVGADFFVFKETYPKRGGSNPWQPAEKLFREALKAGHDSQSIIVGCRLYRDECDRNKITGTEKVAQAQTWLRQARFIDYQPTVAVGPQKIFVRDDTPAGKAWIEYERTVGKAAPRKNDGWWRETLWPKGYEPKEAAE
jgi:hypothetical protein